MTTENCCLSWLRNKKGNYAGNNQLGVGSYELTVRSYEWVVGGLIRGLGKD